MSGQVWEVVGGEATGGIMVRVGKDLKSKEAPLRLATGALIRQVELVGERLSFERLSGAGPSTGWVSLKVKDKELVVKTDKEPPPGPLIVCFYSGGMTAAQGKGQMRHFLQAAGKEGLKDSLVLDHVGEPGYEDCADFSDYVSRLAAKLEAEPKAAGRPLFIVAHSHGTVPAWGLAKRLGERCLKLYVLTRRPPNGDLLDETWGVDCTAKVKDLDERFMLHKMLEAWPNDFLQTHKDADPLPANVKTILSVVRRQYSSPAYPCGTADVGSIVGDDQAAAAPIMGLAAEMEAPRGETAAKMEGWKDFTSGGFELVTVDKVDHMGIMGPASGAYPIILGDMMKYMP